MAISVVDDFRYWPMLAFLEVVKSHLVSILFLLENTLDRLSIHFGTRGCSYPHFGHMTKLHPPNEPQLEQASLDSSSVKSVPQCVQVMPAILKFEVTLRDRLLRPSQRPA
jgi:hypothetical protein